MGNNQFTRLPEEFPPTPAPTSTATARGRHSSTSGIITMMHTVSPTAPLSALSRREQSSTVTTVELEDGVQKVATNRSRVDLSAELGIPLRDIRNALLVNNPNHTLPPTNDLVGLVQSIEALHGVFVVRTLFFVVVMLANKLVVLRFSHVSATGVGQELLARLTLETKQHDDDNARSGADEGVPVPLQVRALEVLLETATQAIHDRLQPLIEKHNAISAMVSQSFGAQGISGHKSLMVKLHNLKKKIAGLFGVVKPLHDNLQNLLDDDVALVLPSEPLQNTNDSTDQAPSELQDLLEHYFKLVSTFMRTLESLERGVADGEAAMNLHLDIVRNELIRIEMLLTIGTFAAASCSVVAGVFGMNLHSHIETHPHAFLIVGGALVMLALIVFVVVLRYTKKRGLL